MENATRAVTRNYLMIARSEASGGDLPRSMAQCAMSMLSPVNLPPTLDHLQRENRGSVLTLRVDQSTGADRGATNG